MSFSREYLEQLSTLERPMSAVIALMHEDDEACDVYEQIKSYAKGLLRNPEDEDSSKKLENLIKTL